MATIVSPEGKRLIQKRSLADRPVTLEGLVVGLLDNNKPPADILLKAIGEELVVRGAREVIYRKKAHPAGPNPYVPELVASVDVAISALGN